VRVIERLTHILQVTIQHTGVFVMNVNINFVKYELELDLQRVEKW
jgi:hypothetical protein